MKKVDILKTLVVVILLLLILGYSFYPILFKKYIENEAFTTLRDYYLVDNLHLYNEEKATQEPRCQTKQTPIHKYKMNSSTSSHHDSKYSNSLNSKISESGTKSLVPIDVRKLGYINRIVQIKQGSLCLIVNKAGELEFRNIKLDMNGYHSSTFRTILGLHGPDTVSFYHPATDKFISRDSKGNLFLANIELVNNSVVKRTVSFKICYGLDDTKKISIVCPMINKENSPRLWTLSKGILDVKNIPRMVKYTDIDSSKYSACDFYLQDIESGVHLGTMYNSEFQYSDKMDRNNQALGIEPFTSNSINGSSSRQRNMRDKRTITSLVNEGVLPEEKQRFLNIGNNSLVEEFNTEHGENVIGDTNKEANVFGVHTGKEFNDILNYDMVGKNYSELLDDNLVSKLQKSKLDPNVQSLLDYNEKYHNVYVQENNDFEKKLDTILEKHLDNVDTNIRRANNYRVGEMAKQLFNAESILAEKAHM